VHGFNESHDSMTCKELQRQIEEAEQRVLYHPAAYGKPGAAGRVQPTGDKRKGRGGLWACQQAWGWQGFSTGQEWGFSTAMRLHSQQQQQVTTAHRTTVQQLGAVGHGVANRATPHRATSSHPVGLAASLVGRRNQFPSVGAGTQQ
jgi:hypothetical protein